MPRKAKSDSKYRKLILLSEIGAYLHDIGKLSRFFVLSKARGMNVKDFHGQILFLDKKILPPRLAKFLFSPLSNITGVSEIKGINLNISLSHFICAHHGCGRCLKNAPCPFKDEIEKHLLIKLLKTVDHLDASNPSNSGKQAPFNLYRDNIFYQETSLPVRKFDEMRGNFYFELEEFLRKNGTKDISELNRFIKSASQKYFENALSETRRFGNDITLLDHSNAVSSLYKAFLYGYLFWNKEIPNSFFNVRFRVMKIKRADEKISHILSDVYVCCNEIVWTDGNGYYLIANFKKNGKFADFVRKITGKEIEFSKTNDLTFIFNDEFFGFSSAEIKRRLNSVFIKRVSDIRRAYTEKQAIEDIKKVILFAELRRKETISAKLKSFEKHLANLSKGSVHDPSNLPKFFKKEREVRLLRKHCNAGVSIEKIKEKYGWKSSRDAENEIYAYFNEVLSPVRPPSPVEMSAYLLKLYHRYGSYKRVFEKFLINRPLVPGRVFAIFRSLKQYASKLRKDEKNLR